MPLNPLPYRVVRQKLGKAGFIPIAQKGSHVKFVKHTKQGLRTVIVPYHKEITIGTLRSILRQAGLTIKEFEAL